MVYEIAANDVLIHDDHKDVFFISILKDPDWYRAEEIRSGSKEGASYIVGEPKPYDRKGKERRYFDKDGKEIELGSEIGSGDEALHSAIAEFVEKIS